MWRLSAHKEEVMAANERGKKDGPFAADVFPAGLCDIRYDGVTGAGFWLS